jgi:hypothetical protein
MIGISEGLHGGGEESRGEDWRLIGRRPGALQPPRGAGRGDGVPLGDVGLEVQDGGAVPGVQVRHFHKVPLHLDNVYRPGT